MRLFFHWFPRYLLYATHSPCPLRSASKVLAVDVFQQHLKSYHVKDIEVKSVDDARGIIYGPNETVIPVKSFLTLLVLEVLNPFYIFQIGSLAVWFTEEYIYYAIAVIFMLIAGAGSSIIQTRRNQMQLRKTIYFSEIATVIRKEDGPERREICVDVLASSLVPGDLIAIPPNGCILPCDAVLLTGNVIVNECMLTGESVPVTKIPIHNDDRKFDESDETTRHSVLYSGTKVLQTRFHGEKWARAVVLRTGFLTSKGQITQSILYPPPVDFRFERDSYKFLGILAIISTAGLLYAVITKYYRGVGPKEIVLKGLVLFTIVIPPALPAAMTIGKLYAQKRLKEIGIFCINSRIINIAGTINCVCFDKDNPLEIGIARQFFFSSSLQRMSVITHALGSSNFNIYCKGSPEMLISLSKPNSVPSDITSVLASYTRKGFRVLALATKSLPTSMTGKEVEEMEREEVESDLNFLGLILFENKLKKATESVVANLRKANIRQVMVTGDNILTAIKVAEECGLVAPKQKVYRLEASPSEVTVLPHFDVGDHLKPTKKVSSISMPHINWARIGSVCDEHHMEGGIPESPPTYALTGQAWAVIRSCHPSVIPKVVKDGTIFSRMTPDQKQQLVIELKGIGLSVAMCGDGANDCAALKSADAGISLSDAESAAASAFTSSCGDVSCVPRVISEGRCALVTSFGIFKFMAGYSLTQFSSVMILYTIDSYLTDFEFLYIDLCLVTLVAALFGLTKPPDASKDLAPRPPSSNLFSFYPILSILLQVLVMVGFQVTAYLGVRLFPWYRPFDFGKQFSYFESPYACYENYAVFAISSFQYLWMAVAFSRGAPHRRWIWSNPRLMCSIAVLGLFCAFLAVLPTDGLAEFFEMAMPPSIKDRALVLPITLLNLILSLFLERVLIEHVLEPGLISRFCKKRRHSTILTDHGIIYSKDHETVHSLTRGRHKGNKG
ncbi:hypothetical protein J437_LFUL003688 [Ladona fulva]|uniref:Cation-transporting ATPase n=1 Tax=Ladona fulva TaxID=123851 RepID=A0A8K0NSV1_LADFU|nr:hypothetical protein J437_LFUL003688 [Ladona fulva]